MNVFQSELTFWIIWFLPLNTYFNPWKVVSFVNSDTFSFNAMVFAELTAKNKQCFNMLVHQVNFKHIFYVLVAVLLIFEFNIEKSFYAINTLHEIADETINLRIVKADQS